MALPLLLNKAAVTFSAWLCENWVIENKNFHMGFQRNIVISMDVNDFNRMLGLLL